MPDLSLVLSLVAGVSALAFVIYLMKDVMKRDPGNELMQEISGAVQEGARAFLRREYIYITIFRRDHFFARSPVFRYSQKEWRPLKQSKTASAGKRV